MKFYFLVILTIVALASCKKEEIKSDPNLPDLPAYSEKGLNVGGILINDKPWLTTKLGLFSTSKPLQLLSYPNGDSIVVLLNGDFKEPGNDAFLKTIFIVIKNIKIISDSDLLKLNSMTYSLDGSTNYGGFSENYGDNKIGKGTGSITFRKVSEIKNNGYATGAPDNPIKHPYILAGNLYMNVTTSANYALTNGRFDVKLLRSISEFVVYQ